MVMRKHFLKVLLLPLLAAPFSALADPVSALTFLPENFYASAIGSHAFVYSDGTVRAIDTGFSRSWASGINDAGQVVGMSETTPDFKSAEPHAFLYQDGTMADLGFLGVGTRSRALGIDNAGLIVGASNWSDDPANDDHGFLFANGAMVDLIDPATGWQIASARDLNDAQQILATACGSGECATVRLDLVSAIPEPHVWGMLLAGLVLMGSRRRHAPPSEIFH